MSSKQLFGCMGAALGVVSGVIGGLAWSGATAKAAHAAVVAKSVKAKAFSALRTQNEQRAAAQKQKRERTRKKRAAASARTAPRLFRRMFRVKATAYTPINTRMEGGRWTATQRDGRSIHGIAVDPRVIPLGTRLWIPGYGHAVADDTGGAIRGHHIDVRLQNRADLPKWGVKQLCVYVLADPPRKLRHAL